MTFQLFTLKNHFVMQCCINSTTTEDCDSVISNMSTIDLLTTITAPTTILLALYRTTCVS